MPFGGWVPGGVENIIRAGECLRPVEEVFDTIRRAAAGGDGVGYCVRIQKKIGRADEEPVQGECGSVADGDEALAVERYTANPALNGDVDCIIAGVPEEGMGAAGVGDRAGVRVVQVAEKELKRAAAIDGGIGEAGSVRGQRERLAAGSAFEGETGGRGDGEAEGWGGAGLEGLAGTGPIARGGQRYGEGPGNPGPGGFGGGRGGRSDFEDSPVGLILQGRDEAVAFAGEGLDEAGLVWGVTERLAEFVDGGVEALFEVDKSGAVPEVVLEFLAADDLTGAFKKEGQDLEWLALQADACAELTEIAGGGFEFERAEADFRVLSRLRSHKGLARVGGEEIRP